MRTRSLPRLFFTDGGLPDGEPVLVITGWTISSAVSDLLAAPLRGHARVLTYDHRGAGRSDPWPGPVSIAMLAADAARVLDDRGIESAHVIGLSLGAGVALELAIRRPDRVRSLCLVGGSAGGPATVLPGPGDAARAVRDLVGETVRHGQLWPAPVLFSEAFRRAHPARVAELTAPFTQHRAPPWASWWQLLAVACYGRGTSLDAVRAPTLVLHGGQDVMTPVGNARRLARAIPGAELRVFPDAGHAVPLEHPEACAELLLAWFARHAAHRPASLGTAARLAERASRPFALQLGTLRNTRDAAALTVRAVARRGRA